MHDSTVLDLGILPEQPPKAVFMRPVTRVGVTVLAVAALFALALSTDWRGALRAAGLLQPAKPAAIAMAPERLRQVEAMTVDDAAQIVVEGSDAELRNAALPVSADPLEHMRRFLISAAAGGARSTALRCLTQAIYYEAAHEPLGGRRAVAQVILNRMRHPAYPKSVCGVVYQGSERRTGCQFSFTCDGSLLRRPSPQAWREAEEVARAALAGHVETSVGTATHYHADYVLPKWAFQLGKIGQLGRHIFYRFNGAWGRATAFSGQYSGFERIPAMNLAALSERLSAEGEFAQGTYTPGLTVPPHVTDRHAAADVGGRLDVTKEWRLTIPDPTEASSRYKQAVADTSATVQPAAQPAAQVAMTERAQGEVSP